MAGVPPLLGFVAKEAAFAALLEGGLADRTAAVVVLAVLVAGSALTVAYTLRFLWGAFARKPGLPDPAPTELGTRRRRCSWPRRRAGRCRARARRGQPAARAAGRRVRRHAARWSPTAHEELALWHGWQPALALSAISLLGGAALFAGRGPVTRLAAPARRRRLGRRGLLER